MRDRKLFVGAGIRRLRDSRSMTQADLARQLRISTAYLSQMETNQRPVSASVLYGLSQLFGADAANLMSEDPDRLAADLREALSDPIFSQAETSHVYIRALALSRRGLRIASSSCTRPSAARSTRPRWVMTILSKNLRFFPKRIMVMKLPF